MATATQPAAAEATEAPAEVQPAAAAPVPQVEAPKADDTTEAPAEVQPEAPAEVQPEAPKAEGNKAAEVYSFSPATILQYLQAKSDEELNESLKKVGTAGFSEDQLLETLELLSQPNVAKSYFAGNSDRHKKLKSFISSLYLRQVCASKEEDAVNLGPVYIETSVGGNAALGIGYKSEEDGIVKKTGFGIYFRADHLRNSGVRTKQANA